ncbi:hypothetical protein SAMN06265218_1288 [Fodinibius sediminis]|uniref:Schlafen group 3-like DNA/RNA helicase domain-containing protein n=2 Tax=Fodinibius sediminis TaxID=1214077 RepID=A0A521FB58_9BACT|nr:hypothetical protein SAMN06265218_1288 [Fodinibius sediminis]
MIVYQADKESFTDDIESGGVEESISYMYESRLNRRVSNSEKRSWKNSLQYMYMVLNDDDIPDDSGISIELQIPQTSKRIDFIIAGQDKNRQDHAVIVELKQWETAQRTNMDGVVKTYFQGGLHNTSHPSYQAWSYAKLLQDFNKSVYEDDIQLKPCAYLHNFTGENVLDHDFYKEYVHKAPVFKQRDHRKLRSFIKKHVKYGDHSDILYRIDNGEIRPSKMLADSLESMLEGNEEFVMIDEQKVAFEYVMNAVESAEKDQKKVILVEGGPGTGKSVIAVNLLVKLIGKGHVTSYVTKNSAPRQVYTSYLTGSMKRSSVENLFRSSGQFIDAEPNDFDALVVDEAHRLNEKSGLYSNQGENQIKEIINASNVSVFFIDEDQRIHINDIGRKEEIRKWADEFDAEVIETELSSQFRCNGSDGYLAWIDHTLQIRDTANTDLSDIDYDFQVYSSPNKLFEEIKKKNEINDKSRVVAGYCWPWESKKDSRAMDIVIPEHGFSKQWNLKDHGQKWLVQEGSMEQVGCIHTCQGLELDYVGVIIGPDFKVREGKVVTDLDERYTYDSSIRGLKKMRKKDPDKAAAVADRIIKNTYRTLMTRGMKGCYIYCTDKETEEYFRNRVR